MTLTGINAVILPKFFSIGVITSRTNPFQTSVPNLATGCKINFLATLPISGTFFKLIFTRILSFLILNPCILGS